MKPLQSRIKRADYGIDAPTVVRNFFLIGVAGWIVGTILPKFGSGHCRTGWLVSMALVEGLVRVLCCRASL